MTIKLDSKTLPELSNATTHTYNLDNSVLVPFIKELYVITLTHWNNKIILAGL